MTEEVFLKEQYRISLFYDLLNSEFRKKFQPKSKFGFFELDIDFKDFEDLLEFSWGEKIEGNISDLREKILTSIKSTVSYLDSIGGSGKYFVKLNTVSSKDWKLTPITADNPEAVIDMLTNSMRVFELGFMPHKHHFPDHPLKLIFKDWIEIEKGTEFRIFVKDKKIVGISRNDNSPEPAIRYSEVDFINLKNFCEILVNSFFSYHQTQINDIVFDVYCDLYDGYISGLNFLEANPYYSSNRNCYTVEELTNLENKISEGYKLSEKDIKIDYPEEIKKLLEVQNVE